MRIEGKPLFSGGLLADHLEDLATLRASEVLSDLGSRARQPSKLAVRRAVTAAIVMPAPLMLITTETSIVMDERGGQGTMTCTIPYSGQRRWLHLAAPAWPALRTPRGFVDQDQITLQAHGWAADAEWLPTILAAELAAVQAHIEAQHVLLERLRRGQKTWVREAIG